MFWIVGVFTAAFDSGIEWLIVKGIADYADSSCAQQNAKSWRHCASVMAASIVMHILSNPTVFCFVVCVYVSFKCTSTSKML